MTIHSPERRRFLVAAITLTGSAVLAPELLIGARAWADGNREALLRITRLLYPHDAVGNDVYADVLDQAIGMVAADQGFDRLLADAGGELDTSLAGDFLAAPPEAQLAALRGVQDRSYFGAILGAVANRLYSHTGTWGMLGYGGPSWEKGGYIDRGAGDIDWLPEADS